MTAIRHVLIREVSSESTVRFQQYTAKSGAKAANLLRTPSLGELTQMSTKLSNCRGRIKVCLGVGNQELAVGRSQVIVRLSDSAALSPEKVTPEKDMSRGSSPLSSSCPSCGAAAAVWFPNSDPQPQDITLKCVSCATLMRLPKDKVVGAGSSGPQGNIRFI